MGEEKQRIVIVEDHLMVREHLALIINKEFDLEVCGEADNIQEAMEIIRNTSPSLAIVDISLNGLSGLELIKGMKALSIPTPAIVLWMHDESLYAERAFRAGARGYITKHRSSHEVLSAIRRVLAGEVYLSEKMVSKVLQKFISGGGKNITSRPVDRFDGPRTGGAGTDRAGQHLTRNRGSPRSCSGDCGYLSGEDQSKMKLESGYELQHFAIQWLRERE